MEFEYSIIKWVLITITWLSSILVSLLAGVDTYIDEKKKPENKIRGQKCLLFLYWLGEIIWC